MLKKLPALCLMAVLLAGCGDNGLSSGGGSATAGPEVAVDTTPLSVVSVAPVDQTGDVSVDTNVLVTFNEAVLPFDVKQIVVCADPCVNPVDASVKLNASAKVLTIAFTAPLEYSQVYTATVLSATAVNFQNLAKPYSWSFKTAAAPSGGGSSTSSSSSSGGGGSSSSSGGSSTSSSSSSGGSSTSSSSSSSGSSSSSSSSSGPLVPLGAVQTVGDFAGTAGMTNTGILTTVNGDLGTTATAASSLTGFHDSTGNSYTEVIGANQGTVTGTIYSCAQSTTGSDSAAPNAVKCGGPALPNADQMYNDALVAYLQLPGLPLSAPTIGSQLEGTTLGVGYGCVASPCVYQSASGFFLITGGDLTLTGSATDVFVFQMASYLTVGDANGGNCQNVTLAGNVLAKNVFWEVGSAATINAAGGCTFVGTVIASAGVSTSTVGNKVGNSQGIVDIEGRLMSLNASVTIVDTVINVPAP